MQSTVSVRISVLFCWVKSWLWNVALRWVKVFYAEVRQFELPVCNLWVKRNWSSWLSSFLVISNACSRSSGLLVYLHQLKFDCSLSCSNDWFRKYQCNPNWLVRVVSLWHIALLNRFSSHSPLYPSFIELVVSCIDSAVSGPIHVWVQAKFSCRHWR